MADKISFQTALIAKTETIAAKRSLLVSLGRGHAKATVFALENPDAAARIHFKRYPEQKQTGVDDATNILYGRNAVLARITNMRIDNMTVKRDKWGYMDKIDVETYLAMLQKIGDIDKTVQASTLYTNELVEEMNRFDVEAVRKLAREYKG